MRFIVIEILRLLFTLSETREGRPQSWGADQGCSWLSVILHTERAGWVREGGAGQAGQESDRHQVEAGGDEDCDQDKVPQAGGPNREDNENHQPQGPQPLPLPGEAGQHAEVQQAVEVVHEEAHQPAVGRGSLPGCCEYILQVITEISTSTSQSSPSRHLVSRLEECLSPYLPLPHPSHLSTPCSPSPATPPPCWSQWPWP